MFGPKITQVFKSRWHALMWSAGVLATAYCSIPTPDANSGGGDAASAQQQAKADAEQAAQAKSIVAAWSKATGGK